MGFSQLYPVFISYPEPQDIRKKYGEVFTATLISLIDNADGNQYPFICRWYYSPDDKKWIVEALGDNHSRANIKVKTFLRF